MAVQSLKHLWFAFSPPLLIASLFGLVAALRRPVACGRLLSLLLMPLSYYLFFVAPIGYNYVRFFLPVCIVLSFFAAKGLGDVLNTQWLSLAMRRGVVVVALAYPLTWAVAVDLLMLGDARYSAEGWLRTDAAKATAIGVGRKKCCPAG